MITYSIEKLYHFSCARCKKWWSIGDFDTKVVKVITCPHCGEVDAASKDRRVKRRK